MNTFWVVVSVVGILLVGTYGVSLWWSTIRDLFRKIPPPPTKD